MPFTNITKKCFSSTFDMNGFVLISMELIIVPVCIMYSFNFKKKSEFFCNAKPNVVII